MFQALGKVRRFKPKDREYVFDLYSFESKTDFSSNEILEGQSIVFISERFEKDGKHGHNILYTACTNDLVRVGSYCDWTSLSEKMLTVWVSFLLRMI